METTTTTTTPPHRPTQHKHPVPTASLLPLGVGGQAWKSPELSIHPPCPPKSSILLRAITTITISNSPMEPSGSRDLPSWTYTIR